MIKCVNRLYRSATLLPFPYKYEVIQRVYSTFNTYVQKCLCFFFCRNSSFFRFLQRTCSYTTVIVDHGPRAIIFIINLAKLFARPSTKPQKLAAVQEQDQEKDTKSGTMQNNNIEMNPQQYSRHRKCILVVFAFQDVAAFVLTHVIFCNSISDLHPWNGTVYHFVPYALFWAMALVCAISVVYCYGYIVWGCCCRNRSECCSWTCHTVECVLLNRNSATVSNGVVVLPSSITMDAPRQLFCCGCEVDACRVLRYRYRKCRCVWRSLLAICVVSCVTGWFIKGCATPDTHLQDHPYAVHLHYPSPSSASMSMPAETFNNNRATSSGSNADDVNCALIGFHDANNGTIVKANWGPQCITISRNVVLGLIPVSALLFCVYICKELCTWWCNVCRETMPGDVEASVVIPVPRRVYHAVESAGPEQDHDHSNYNTTDDIHS